MRDARDDWKLQKSLRHGGRPVQSDALCTATEARSLAPPLTGTRGRTHAPSSSSAGFPWKSGGDSWFPLRLLSLMEGGGSPSSSTPSAFTVAGAAGAAVSLVCCASGLTVQWTRGPATPEREPQAAPLLASELIVPKPGVAAESYTRRVGALGSGNDATPPEPGHTLASAVARCAAIGAVGFTFCGRLTAHETDTTATLPLCYFKTAEAGSCSS